MIMIETSKIHTSSSSTTTTEYLNILYLRTYIRTYVQYVRVKLCADSFLLLLSLPLNNLRSYYLPTKGPTDLPITVSLLMDYIPKHKKLIKTENINRKNALIKKSEKIKSIRLSNKMAEVRNELVLLYKLMCVVISK